MAFRFRRTIKILPGIRVNLGSRSASVTVGGRGAHLTLRPGHRARATVSLPGSGLSYTQGGNVVRQHVSGGQGQPPREVNGFGWFLAAVVLVLILAIEVSHFG